MHLKVSALFVILGFLLVAAFGWLLGGFLIVAVVVLLRPIARLKLVRNVSMQLYDLLETKLFHTLDTHHWITTIVRSNESTHQSIRVGSREELQHLIDHSDAILSGDEKRLLVHSLSFNTRLVGDVMTTTRDIIRIKKSEFLGPLTLDELHKSGHSRLPVVAQDIDHIVGILHLDTLLALDIKRSVTAEKAMDTHVHYIRHDQTLPRALAAMLRTHQHLFIVIDESRQTKGLITLDDIINALVGQRLVEEFDGHESIRAVADRNPSNNQDED
jgi:CBS domain containing-hemolysin-like protein